MAWTQAQLDAFDAAMAASRGALTLTFENQTLTFQSYSEQLAFRVAMVRDLARSAGTPTTRYAVTSKGL